MAEFKVSKGPRGRSLYFRKDEKGFKMVSKSSVPEDILVTLEPNKSVDDTKPEFRKCIFCGQPATEEKWLNGDKHYLCFDDYQSRTSGELAEKLRLSVANPA